MDTLEFEVHDIGGALDLMIGTREHLGDSSHARDNDTHPSFIKNTLVRLKF